VGNLSPPREWAVIRLDLVRAALLALMTGLLWCAIEDRWTAESWQTPLTYLSDPAKGDVLITLAGIKAAEEGHLRPFFFTNVPELGAPFVANWDDFPATEKPLTCLTGLLARMIGLFAAANFAVMLAQVLAAVSFYAACRLAGGSWPWSFAGALAFAFSTYAFSHGLHHLPVTYYWHIPLCLLVCGWIFRGEGLRFGGGRFLFAIAVAFVTGIQNVYYTGLFAQFVLIGGLVQAWRRGWNKALPAVAVVGTAAAAFLLMNLNTIFYGFFHGGNERAVVRDYHWLEVYGLKIVDLVVPPPDHPFPLFAAWGTQHVKEVLLSPGESPGSGYLGIIGLTALAWLTLVSLRRAVERRTLPLAAWFILWIFLYGSVGGLNGVLGVLGFQLFRATTRYSIFILCIVLMYAVGRLSLVKWKNKFLFYGAAILVALLALADQTSPWVSDQDLAKTAQAVDSDRRFAASMEQRLSPGAMVFQLPIMAFPESPAPGVGSYDHFRPYLYAHDLRFSFGSDKGRPEVEWQQELTRLSLSEVIQELESYGFSALYINRNGFPNQAQGLVKALQAEGLNDMIESDRHDLVCVFLKPSPQPVLPNINTL
jgi:phosphoglycerol transferase